MAYFIILILITVIFGFLHRAKLCSKKTACCFISSYALFLYTIRSDKIGNIDISRYVEGYLYLNKLTYPKIYQEFSRDQFFYVLSKPLADLGFSYSVWFFVIGLLLIYAITKLILNHSNNLILSYSVFYTFFYTLNFSLLRHCCAFSLVVLAYMSIKNQKYKQYALFVFLGSLLHLSALLALLLIPAIKIKFSKLNFVIIALAYIVSLTVTDFLSDILMVFSMDRFSAYASGNVMTLTHSIFYIFLLFLLFISFSSKNIRNSYSFELNMLTIALIFYAFVPALAEFLRTAMFFSFVTITMLPKAISEYSKKTPALALAYSFVLFTALITYLFAIVLYDHFMIPFSTIFESI